MSSLTCHPCIPPGLFRCPLCIVLSTSHVIQRLTQSLLSLHSTCPKYLNLLFLIIKLISSNPKSSRSSSLSFSLTPHVHLIIFISVRFKLQFMIYFHRPVLTRTLFQLDWVSIHKTFSKQIWLKPLMLNHILHLHPTCLINNRIYLPFQWYPNTNIQLQISIKPICDWPIYLTASAMNDWLASSRLPFTLLHCL